MNSLSTPSIGADALQHPTHDEVSERARDLWERRGRPAGTDDQIWLEAERQLLAERNSSAPAKVTPETAASSVAERQLEASAKTAEETTTKPRGRSRAPRGRAAS